MAKDTRQQTGSTDDVRKYAKELEEKVAKLEEDLKSAERRTHEAQGKLDELRAKHAAEPVLTTEDQARLQGAEVLRSLAIPDTVRVSGFIIQDLKGERHVVHEVTGGAGVVRVEPLERGEDMPWHAARDVAMRHFENKVIPEGKR